MAAMVVVKKYGNRRLYDTEESRYVTLEELAAKVRQGKDVRVVDARTEADLTQATLTQIILESRGAGRLLPVPLLLQLIRLGDEALAEFFGRFLSTAFSLYLHARREAQHVANFNPFALLPFATTNALAQILTRPLSLRDRLPSLAPPAASAAPAAGADGGGLPLPEESFEELPEPMPELLAELPTSTPPVSDEVAALRRELEDIKRTLRKRRK